MLGDMMDLTRLPMWVAGILGIGAGIYHLRRRRVQAALVIVASATTMLLLLADVTRRHWLLAAKSSAADPAETYTISGLIIILESAGHAACLIALICAAFWPMRRKLDEAIEVSRDHDPR